jgi:hypothetical protein
VVDGLEDRMDFSTDEARVPCSLGDCDYDLTFLGDMLRKTSVAFNDDVNIGLGFSICDRRSVDSGEGEEESCKSGREY